MKSTDNPIRWCQHGVGVMPADSFDSNAAQTTGISRAAHGQRIVQRINLYSQHIVRASDSRDLIAKIAIWRAFPSKNSLNAAPALEFDSFGMILLL